MGLGGRCGSTPAKAANPQGKAGVVCLSRGDNTREAAKQIGEITGSELFELLPAKPYTPLRRGGKGVEGIEEAAEREVKERFQPKLKNLPDDLDRDDAVCRGSPCWFNTTVLPIASFPAAAALSGKTVVPFMTHGGSRMEKAWTTSTVLPRMRR